jgi:O-antigen ligase
MNFEPWFGHEYNYSQKTASGKEVVGVTLHNTYQTWALEGGVPCLLISVYLLWKYFNILVTRIRRSIDNTEKSYYKLLIISMCCLLLEGLFHQIHQTPVFFILIGIVYALELKFNKKNQLRQQKVHC